jgi:hypothetical protein
VSYDRDGAERPEEGAMFSDEVAAMLAGSSVTDVILVSHGWNGDLPAARAQYARWFATMLGCAADRAALAARPGGFRPLVVGLHWPSRAWGDEDLGSASFAVAGAGRPGAATGVGDLVDRNAALLDDDLVDRYAALLDDNERVRAALRVIFAAAVLDIAPDTMPPEVAAAYAVLDAESRLGAAGAGAQPGSDREPFDAEAAYEEAMAEEDLVPYGGGSLGGLLAPLRTLTFWSMKRRACRFGETGAAALLRRLRDAVPAGREVRLHLIGHSFGCIVVSAAVTGAPPVDTLVLVQGALSLWSYADRIPGTTGRSGYFRRIMSDHLVRGAVVTTMSRHDRAVGVFYPLGAAAARQTAYPVGGFPTYGAVGAFGLRGLTTTDMPMRDAAAGYGFRPGGVYNLESSRFIAHGGGSAGAHSDICHPEVAHAVWEAVAVPPGG